MSMLSKFSFHKNFNNVDFLSKNQASKYGVGSTKFEKADTNGDNKISIDEILANDEVCAELMAQITNVSSALNMTKNKISKTMTEKREVVEEIMKQFDNAGGVKGIKDGIKTAVKGKLEKMSKGGPNEPPKDGEPPVGKEDNVIRDKMHMFADEIQSVFRNNDVGFAKRGPHGRAMFQDSNNLRFSA